MSRNLARGALALVLSPIFNGLCADTELPPTVVTATRQAARVDEVLADVTVIDRKTIEQAGNESIIDLIARQPGIQSMQNGGIGTASQLYIRGSRTDQVKVLVDGIPINSIDINGSPLRFIPLADVDRIEILRGPGSALYGADAIGGVIQVFTRRSQEGLHGEAAIGAGSYGTLKRNAAISGGDEQWRFNFAGSDYRTDGISAIRNGRNTDSDRDPFREMGYQGSLSYSPNQDHEITANFMSNHGQTFTDSSTGTGTFNSRVDFVNSTLGLNSRNKFTDRWTSTFRYGQSYDDQASYTSAVASVTQTRTSQLTWQNDVKLGLGTGLVALERLDQHVGPAFRFSGNKVDSHNDAIILGWNANIASHRWQLSSRRDDNSSFGQRNTWSAAYGYQISNAWRMNGSVGTSFKAPTPYQLYATIAGSLIANPALQPEQGRNKELTLNWDGVQQNASITWYRNDLTNLIDYQSAAKQYQNINQAKLEGWTLAWSGKVDDWTFNSSLDLLEARDLTTHRTLDRRAKEKMTFGANHRWGNWDLGSELIMVGRRYAQNSAGNTEALPMGGYSLINVAARTDINKDLSFELRLDNLTDKPYATARTTNGNYFYNAPGMTWFAGLRYKM